MKPRGSCVKKVSPYLSSSSQEPKLYWDHEFSNSLEMTRVIDLVAEASDILFLDFFSFVSIFELGFFKAEPGRDLESPFNFSV
jgi:hypothetical protein